MISVDQKCTFVNFVTIIPLEESRYENYSKSNLLLDSLTSGEHFLAIGLIAPEGSQQKNSYRLPATNCKLHSVAGFCILNDVTPV
jgi:hypothetical protein